ncbi:mediator of RNA polymerase II transcription subunit 17 [Arachis duranensis]|uniref:Mediator of RNA polymerase II transcription subunit 17 n=1 Tax=Arachis duranensis TaxID=130453 RepID=A0A6P4C0K2_ARADU|nr:mediator of RNA polymerase II transcription subunit 17 [Arachis duranensis]XP_015939048.1 mediator of RNA polymerase II transcription subunit 17 [Arachis duranensis]
MEEGTQLQVSIDKLPIKRLESIEENGIERFPSDVDYDEKRLSLIRRIDFAWAVEKDDEEKNKKQKKASKEASTPWQWQSMVENLQLAHQELSVIIDLINTVEANDAVTVASMTRPKLLSNEALSDLAVSAATKLQCYRHVGKYFKQSAKAFERQVAREARFYGALIRLQQNWKVKRQRQAAIAPGSEGFTFDLFDTSYDQGAIYRSSSTSTVRVNHNPAGMLAINVSPNSCHSLQFGFVGAQSEERLGKSEEHKSDFSDEHHMEETDKKPLNDEVCVKKTHSLLREVHKAIFNEQVFDLVNREAFNASTGVTVTGIRENYLQLSLGQGTSVYLSLVPSDQDRSAVESESNNDVENANLPESSDEMECDAKHNTWKKEEQFHHSTCYEIYIQQIFHDYIFGRGSEKPVSSGSRLSGAQAKDGSGLLGHFFMSLAHRIFSIKVLKELENVACKVPYLQLISNPTWNSRASSWTLNMEVPQSIIRTSDFNEKNASKRQFWTKVLVNDDCINVKAEGSPNVSGLFKGKAEETHTINRYDCNIADLAVVILQQVASQIINWLYHEAMMVGIKANRDFLSLCFELEQGETLCLIANVDPEDIEGCISWWLVMADSFAEEQKLHMNMNMNDGASEYRKFLGHLSLELLYATLMDLVGLCCGGGGGH